MKKMHAAIGLALLASLALSCNALAVEAPKRDAGKREQPKRNPPRADSGKNDIKNLALGTYICGPERKTSDFTNRTVLIGFWNINTGATLNSLTIYQEWQKKNEDQGLIVIGMSTHKFSNEAIEGVCNEKGVTYSIYCEGTYNKATPGPGTVIIFDYAGKCVYNGTFEKSADELKAALAKAPGNILGPKEIVKLKALAESLRAGTSPPQVLKKVQALQKSEDKDTAEEAKYIVECIRKWAQNQLDVAKTIGKTEALRCRQMVEDLAKDLQGTEVEETVTAAEEALKQDKEYQAELTAYDTLDKVKEIEKKFKKQRTPEKFNKANAAGLKELKDAAEKLQKDSPKSKATQEVVAMAIKYKLIEDPNKPKQDDKGKPKKR